MKFAYSCFFAVFASYAIGGDGIDCLVIAAATYGIISAADLLARVIAARLDAC